MASGKPKVIPFRRKRQAKTDYGLRLNMLKSGETRFVVRRTLKGIIIQAVKYEAEGDKVLFTVTSTNLKKMGYKHSTSNIPAAYLTGLLAGKKALDMKIKSGILDMGLFQSIKGSRIYSALKGLVDSGLDIPCSSDVFPSDERVAGHHITEHKGDESLAKDVEELKNKITA